MGTGFREHIILSVSQKDIRVLLACFALAVYAMKRSLSHTYAFIKTLTSLAISTTQYQHNILEAWK